MENDKHLFYIVAIIAIVAIFGIVFMSIKSNVASATKSTLMDSPPGTIVGTDQVGGVYVIYFDGCIYDVGGGTTRNTGICRTP